MFEKQKQNKQRDIPGKDSVGASVQRFVVKLLPQQTFSITHCAGDVVSIYIDTRGNVYPEQYREAIAHGILINEQS